MKILKFCSPSIFSFLLLISCSTGDKCNDECSTSGSKDCSGNGYVVCGQYDSDDCLESSSVTNCSSTETCVNGDCVSACLDDCSPLGTKDCDGNGYRDCGQYDSDTCLEWSTITTCSSTETCSNGVCASVCLDDCSPSGILECAGNGYRDCGQYDSDTCLEWSTITDCGSGKTCQNGTCVQGCTDECSTSGSKDCSGSGYRTCGINYDSDSCLEWSSVTDCLSGQICSNGTCVQGCTDECSPSGSKDCSGSGYRTCGSNYDSDSCLDWSSVTDCGSGYICSGGSCITQTTTSYSNITLRVRDLCYDGYRIDYRYYDEDNDLAWPSYYSNYYTSYPNVNYTSNLKCVTGAKICMGAETGLLSWGVGLYNQLSCTGCCVYCIDGSVKGWDLNCP